MVSRNLKRRHLTKPQRDVVIAKLRSMPQWANASNRAIAKEIGVDEATVRRAQGLSAADAADAPQHTVTVKRGEQEYRMRVERKPDAERDAVPLTSEPTTAAVAEANRQRQARTDARVNRRDVRVVFRQLSDADRRRFLAEANTIDDVVAWGASALDAQRREVADAYFDALRSNDERLKHDEVVRAWVESYESDERA